MPYNQAVLTDMTISEIQAEIDAAESAVTRRRRLEANCDDAVVANNYRELIAHTEADIRTLRAELKNRAK